jgi:UDP-N-acetylmuramoylalanine--D-glutamate ligase
MLSTSKIKGLSFLVYGLGLTGQSVVKFFKKNNIKNYKVWDDKKNKLFKKKRTKNLKETICKVDYIILSPGISLLDKRNKNFLINFEKKIITDIDLFYLINKNFKSIVVTGTNGKSTTCMLINHLLKNNKFKVLLGGNIGTPILDLKIKKNVYVIIEASSFQLSHSKFICPDYAFLLNITNDHLDWHNNMKNYINSKFKIFNKQKKNQFAIINNKIENYYLRSIINEENMSFVYAFSKLLKIDDKAFVASMKSFVGLAHRYEIFLKKKNIVFINDSKATSFEASKNALLSSKNIFWILGGLPKKNDKIILSKIKKNIVKCYLIGKNISFFKKQVQNKVSFLITKNLKKTIIQIFRDIKILNKKNNTILLSPSAASYDQFKNFENRGNNFKKLSKFYARKYI